MFDGMEGGVCQDGNDGWTAPQSCRDGVMACVCGCMWVYVCTCVCSCGCHIKWNLSVVLCVTVILVLTSITKQDTQ